jgi:hypothetical protein
VRGLEQQFLQPGRTCYWFNHYDTLNNWEHFMINVYK